MLSYEQTALWQRTLGARARDPHAKERERLRVAFERARSNAEPLATAIGTDHPEYTVHDITHSDALWEYADLIAGPNYAVTPSEAFVLGSAFLLHDLGMGLAAYGAGVTELKALPLWRDTVADLLRAAGTARIDPVTIDDAPEGVQRIAGRIVLRQLHAQRAAEIAISPWVSPEGEALFIVDDSELRDAYGPIIGRVSASHWWSLSRLVDEFPAEMGGQVGFPAEWTVDPLKLACLLRCADYCHIDAGRAPAFLRTLRQPMGESDDHWRFQSKLYRPRRNGDRLVFTAKKAFAANEADAWWLCFDTISAIDAELRKVDALLADRQRARLAVRGVEQIEEPSRLARLVATEGWRPVDTRIRISAVARVVSMLGGSQLYGDSLTPPLRELIQNASDAVRARRMLDSRSAEWGEIRVDSGIDDTGPWIQVEDTGVGMSESLLTGPLLEFGSQFWGSSLMHEQLPGLAAAGFDAAGQYGIGFFSVFIWGSRVQITSQRFDASRESTNVLEIAHGISGRPLLRPARLDEFIPDAGTRIKVWFSRPADFDALLRPPGRFTRETASLEHLCGTLAPCLDVTLRVKGTVVLTAGDWLTIEDTRLLDRLAHENIAWVAGTAPPLHTLVDQSGAVLGRVALWPEGWAVHSGSCRGIVTAGGFRASRINGVVGVMLGRTTRVSRDSASLMAPTKDLQEWVKQEGARRLDERHPPEKLAKIAETMAAFGVFPKDLPVAQVLDGWVTPREFARRVEAAQEVVLLDANELPNANGGTIRLKQDVYVVDTSAPPILLDEHDEFMFAFGRERDAAFGGGSLRDVVMRTLARAWGLKREDLSKCVEEDFREICTLDEDSQFHTVEVFVRPQVSATE